MNRIFINILEMSFSASILVLVLLFLKPVLKKFPSWIKCLLWSMVGLRLTCPISFHSRFSLIPDWNKIIGIKTDSGLNYKIATSPGIITDATSLSKNAVQSTQILNFSNIDTTSILSFVWIAGITILIILSVAKTIKLKNNISASIRLKDDIYICDEINTPFIFGFFNPKIYVPSGLDKKTMNYAILHEKAHIKRGDNFWKPLGFFILLIHWFNPLIWIAYFSFCKDIEYACDEKVIRRFNNESISSYSQALLNCSLERRSHLFYPVGFGENSVKGRIKSILNYKKPKISVLFVSIIIVLLLTALFLTNPLTDNGNYKQGINNFSIVNNRINGSSNTQIIENKDKNGNPVSYNKLFFNSNGTPSEQITFDTQWNVISKREYIQNNNGWISEIMEYDNNGELLSKAKYTRDDNGNELSCKAYFPDNSFCWWNEYSYDSKGNPVKYTRFNEDGSIYYTWKSRFDNNGLEKIRVCSNNQGEEIWTQLFTYNSDNELLYSEQYSPEGELLSRTDYSTV